jgi:hypothetical protein
MVKVSATMSFNVEQSAAEKDSGPDNARPLKPQAVRNSREPLPLCVDSRYADPLLHVSRIINVSNVEFSSILC